MNVCLLKKYEKRRVFLHKNLHKYTRTTPDGKTHN